MITAQQIAVRFPFPFGARSSSLWMRRARGPALEPEDQMKTTKKTQTTEKALDAFLAKVVEIRTTLAAIQEAADDHFDLTPD